MKSKSLLFALLFCLLGRNAEAQFLQTDVNVYQLPDPKRETVVIMTTKGVFVANTETRAGSLASFDPQQLTPANSRSLFLEYTPQTQVPERLVLPGNGNQFRIRGTFTVTLPPYIRVAVAMNANSIPYISIVSFEKGEEAILGFVGQQLVVNLAGAEAVEALEADPLRRQFGTVAAAYDIHTDNRLHLLDRPVALESTIGLLSLADNPCLPENVELRWEDNAGGESVAAALPGASPTPAIKKKRSPKLNLSSFLLLNVSAESMVGIHYDSGKFVAITEDESATDKVCVIRPLKLPKRILRR